MVFAFLGTLRIYRSPPSTPSAFQLNKVPSDNLPTRPRRGWSGGAMVLRKLPVPGRPTIWMTVGPGPTALAVGAGGGCLDIFSLIYPISILSPSLWETARYKLKYCLKGPLSPNQPTNQTQVINPIRLPSELIRIKARTSVVFYDNLSSLR